MKKTILFILALITIVSALVSTGCSTYTSKYQAVGFVHSNTDDSAYMTFYSFEGTMVFKLKADSTLSGAALEYKTTLESGNVKIYYDFNGTKTELVSLKSGDEFSSHVDINKGTVYVIVETDGKCQNGDFRFNIDYYNT